MLAGTSLWKAPYRDRLQQFDRLTDMPPPSLENTQDRDCKRVKRSGEPKRNRSRGLLSSHDVSQERIKSPSRSLEAQRWWRDSAPPFAGL